MANDQTSGKARLQEQEQEVRSSLSSETVNRQGCRECSCEKLRRLFGSNTLWLKPMVLQGM